MRPILFRLVQRNKTYLPNATFKIGLKSWLRLINREESLSVTVLNMGQTQTLFVYFRPFHKYRLKFDYFNFKKHRGYRLKLVYIRIKSIEAIV